MVQLVITGNRVIKRQKLQVDDGAQGMAPGLVRGGRGGDRGGRRPVIGDTRLPNYKVYSDDLETLRDMTTPVGRGRSQVAEFVRTLMSAAAGMKLTLSDWQVIARSPVRFRAALLRELGRIE